MEQATLGLSAPVLHNPSPTRIVVAKRIDSIAALSGMSELITWYGVGCCYYGMRRHVVMLPLWDAYYSAFYSATCIDLFDHCWIAQFYQKFTFDWYCNVHVVCLVNDNSRVLKPAVWLLHCKSTWLHIHHLQNKKLIAAVDLIIITSLVSSIWSMFVLFKFSQSIRLYIQNFHKVFC